MNLVIVYDSVFGNTKELAQTMGAAAASHSTVVVKHRGEVTSQDISQADMVVVASPTRAFNPTPELKEFLKDMAPGSLTGKRVAAWDTRVDVAKVNSKLLSGMVSLFGYAAPKLLTILKKKGGTAAAEAEGFFVEDKEGPVMPGEAQRAEAWISTLVKSSGERS
ncbi:flavodoxin family protein [Spirochaeta lutea]|uniref:Flavodoxin-like domain-containing protein n=1 Tax=Spirochaeta lutea TaxID=1480694 RepID=A0A098R0A7_9SPIO|nr:flavodoxin domain-containing protein [Spirochaeta lutea]KGE73191.1 hypothetical protein DC28_05315 [Spirochaeta lutea]